MDTDLFALHDLGRDEAALGHVDTPRAPAAIAARGLAPGSNLRGLVKRDDFAPQRVPSQAGRLAGMRLYEAMPGGVLVLGVAADKPTELQVRWANLTGESLLRDGMLWLRPAAEALCAIERADGSGLVVARGGRHVAELRARGAGEFRAAESPLPQAVRSVPLPAWLAGAMATLSWPPGCETVAAAGLTARHGVVVDPVDQLQAILSGVSAPLHPAHNWIAALDRKQRHAWGVRLTAEARALGDDLQHLDETMDLDDSSWRAELATACWHREILACARNLLAWLGEAEALDRALDVIDRKQGRWCVAVPRPLRLDDARLAAVARIDPSAWWARFSG